MRATHPGGFDVDDDVAMLMGIGLITLEQASTGSVGIMIPNIPLEGMSGPKFACVDEAWRPTEPL